MLKTLFALFAADLWTLAGVVAIEEMGGPAIKWRPGRTDTSDESRVPPNGRLPGADKGADKDTAQHMRDVFYRMGFNDKEIVALLGQFSLPLSLSLSLSFSLFLLSLLRRELTSISYLSLDLAPLLISFLLV